MTSTVMAEPVWQAISSLEDQDSSQLHVKEAGKVAEYGDNTGL